MQDRPGILFHQACTNLDISIRGSEHCMIVKDHILDFTMTKYEIAKFIFYNIIKEKIVLSRILDDSNEHFKSELNYYHDLPNLSPFVCIKDPRCWINFIDEFKCDEYDDFQVYKISNMVNY